jgi:hypothetical protein
MDAKWRNGSKQFIDFVVTLKDPDGEMTLAEVQAIPFEILVQTGLTTPAREDAGWSAPSVEKEVTEVAGTFPVAIRHMYEALETGLHAVFVKFGPTPEEPIYLAAQFVVL